MCANSEFNYNEFIKLVGVKKACDDIFDYAMWSFSEVELRIELESTFINRLKNRVVHLIKKICKYSDYDINKIATCVEIFNKTDVKGLYNEKFKFINDVRMKGYMRCKTFCNKISLYMNGLMYDVCYRTGYDDVNCREVEGKIYNELLELFHEC